MVISCQFSSLPRQELSSCFPQNFHGTPYNFSFSDPPLPSVAILLTVTHCGKCSSYQEPITSVCSSGRKCSNLGFPRQNRTINVFRLSCRPHNRMALFFHLSWSWNFTASWMNFLFGQNFQLCFKFCLSGGKPGLF